MNTHKLEESIKQKRDDYFLGIINQFQQSDEKQTLHNCYNYVKSISNQSSVGLTSSFTEDEMEIFLPAKTNFLLSLYSLETFAIYLKNKEIHLTQE